MVPSTASTSWVIEAQRESHRLTPPTGLATASLAGHIRIISIPLARCAVRAYSNRPRFGRLITKNLSTHWRYFEIIKPVADVTRTQTVSCPNTHSQPSNRLTITTFIHPQNTINTKSLPGLRIPIGPERQEIVSQRRTESVAL